MQALFREFVVSPFQFDIILGTCAIITANPSGSLALRGKFGFPIKLLYGN
jgi:hypothetical protein